MKSDRGFPCAVDGFNKYSTIYNGEAVNKYQNFLERIADLRQQERPDVRIREIEQMTNNIKYANNQVISTLNNPFYIFSFDYEGNVSTFCPELLTNKHEQYGDFIFGNVTKDSLNKIFATEKFKQINQEIQKGKQKCAETCEYFSLCGGGNPSNKLAENGTFESTETIHCRLTIKATCNAVLSHLERKMQQTSVR